MTEEAFDQFWKAYPRREAKGEARKAWAQAQKKPDWPGLEPVLAAIHKARDRRQWQDRQYIPLPATWLRAERWGDEIVESRPFGGLTQEDRPAEVVVFEVPAAVHRVADSLGPTIPYRDDFRGRILRLENEHPEIVEKALILIERDILEALWAKLDLPERSEITEKAQKHMTRVSDAMRPEVYKNLRNQAIRKMNGLRVLSIFENYGEEAEP